MAKSVTSHNIPCTILIRQGDLDGQVQEVISENQIDLLVLATKAGTAMSGFALASTAERILRKTMIPVLTIAGTHQVRKWTGDGCLHLFYATDLSPNSLRSLEYARNLRHRFCVEFTIAHVLPKNASLVKTESVTLQLKALAEGTSTKIAVLQGSVGPALCQASAKACADLIVVGVKNHSLLRELLLGHILLELLHGACCPVITIRQ
jgi:nucleotide-binding universal stress UspA family protein